ncbi:MAG: histidine phosphatase family protein [Nocardioides sp.]
MDRVLADHAGGTVLVVSHVTPIKTLVSHALQAPLTAVFRMELAPASVSVVAWFPAAAEGGQGQGDAPTASLRLYNARPTDEALWPSLR